jgi:hypothetical protein
MFKAISAATIDQSLFPFGETDPVTWFLFHVVLSGSVQNCPRLIVEHTLLSSLYCFLLPRKKTKNRWLGGELLMLNDVTYSSFHRQ